MEEWRLVAETVGEPASALAEMVAKVELVLLPLSLGTLSADEWGLVHAESPCVGWRLVPPREGWLPPLPSFPSDALSLPAGKAVALPSGGSERRGARARAPRPLRPRPLLRRA